MKTLKTLSFLELLLSVLSAKQSIIRVEKRGDWIAIHLLIESSVAIHIFSFNSKSNRNPHPFYFGQRLKSMTHVWGPGHPDGSLTVGHGISPTGHMIGQLAGHFLPPMSISGNQNQNLFIWNKKGLGPDTGQILGCNPAPTKSNTIQLNHNEQVI